MNVRPALIDHLQFFEELGVTGVTRDGAWRARAAAIVAPPPRRSEHPGTLNAPPVDVVASPVTEAPSPVAEEGSSQRAWTATASPIPVSMFDPVVTVPVAKSAAEALALIRQKLGDCTRCKLHRLGRRQVVFGVGNPQAAVMFIGEAPGYEEDVQGIPFVGRAGQLLTKIVESIGLTRDDVYIANVIKCRPPENRNPEQGEIHTCQPFLLAQIDAIKPTVIVALGTIATRALLMTEDPISRLRGRVYRYRDAWLVPTFHPAFLLRSPASKREVWEDMKRVKDILRGDESEA